MESNPLPVSAGILPSGNGLSDTGTVIDNFVRLVPGSWYPRTSKRRCDMSKGTSMKKEQKKPKKKR
jgi:hypothetical protein